jgi:2,4-dienoyl-CoA reductase-like NADH-dependent reductase (Old Yellow Enzyme family)
MSLFEPFTLTSGHTLKNRFMLAPLTNMQSGPDGRLGDDEYRWLCRRAAGGFGLTMTCATYVQKDGIGFGGQLGIYTNDHVEGLSRLASGLKRYETHAVVQLYHGGMRSPRALISRSPQCPSDDAETGARAMTAAEIEAAIEDFIQAARRAQRAGFDGVEIHGAHGYLVCQFLSPDINRRDDDYGGSLAGRSRFLFDIVEGVRAACGSQFSLGVRLSPERFGMRLDEVRTVARRLIDEGRIDYLDLSLWDVFKEPTDEAFKGRGLLSYFTELERGRVRLGAAGKITTGEAAARALASGLDFVVIGRAAILRHDFPGRIMADPAFEPVALPVSAEHLRAEGLGEPFIGYMRTWKGFVETSA